MKVKKAIKKIVALGVGASMMGATLLGATAADLADYPSPFVMDGMFDGMMVVGDDAAAADIIGVTDIAMSLQFSSTVTRTVSSSGASGVSLSGDAAEVGESNDLLELYEQIGNVKETFTDADLEALQSGVVSTDKGTTDYNQYLRLQDSPTTGFPTSASTNYVVYSENEDEEVGDFLYFADGQVMFEFELEFEEGFESDVTQATGTTYCGDLEDLEDEVLHMLGSSFAVINAEVTDGADSNCTDEDSEDILLELMSGDVSDTLEEGETKTYNIAGKDYEVTLVIVSDASEKVKFKVNGEVTDEMVDGDTDVLNDGTEIGIRSVLSNEAGETAGGDVVEFYLGANKVVLDDNNVNDDAFATTNSVEIGEENIEAAQLVIKGTPTGSGDFRVNTIKYRLEADSTSGDLFVPPGHGVKEYLDEPQGMLSELWDIRYEGLMEVGTSDIKLDPSGDDTYRLKFTNLQGLEYTFDILDDSGNGGVIGEDKGTAGSDGGAYAYNGTAAGHYATTSGRDSLWIYDDDFMIAEDDYFTLSETGGVAGTADERSFTNILKFESIDTDDGVVTFTDLAGGTKTATYSLDATTQNLTGSLVVSGNTFAFRVISDGEAAAATGEATGHTTSTIAVVDVDQDQDGAYAAGNVNSVVMTAEGGALLLWQPGVTTGCAVGDHTLVVKTLGGEFDEGADGTDEQLALCIDDGTSAVDVGVLGLTTTAVSSGANLTMHSLPDNDDVSMGMTPYGLLVKETDDTNNADAVTIEYPLAQRGAQVFVVAGETKTSGGSSGGALTYEEPIRIEVGSAVLASKVADATSTNVISVGGSCINKVTASLLGLSYPACGEASGLAEGEAVLKLVESGDNVAIVVAGWSADDTTRATRVLADYGKWQDAGKLKGMEVKVTGTSLTNFDVMPASE